MPYCPTPPPPMYLERMFYRAYNAADICHLNTLIEEGWLPVRETPMGNSVLVLFERKQTRSMK